MIYDDDFQMTSLSSRDYTFLNSPLFVTDTPWSFGSPSVISGWGPFDTSKVKFKNRLNSFKHWPIQMTQRPIDLAKSGFFYTEMGDAVTCFHCGIKLLKWESSDLPDVEHKKHSPNCKYLRMTHSL